MNIQDIAGRQVKLCPRSICIKDSDGKTAGVVPRVQCFADLRPNVQIEHFQKLRAAGIWDNGLSGQVYFDAGRLYYLNDTRRIENLKAAAALGYAEDGARAAKLEDVAARAAQYMQVLDVAILH